MIKFISALIVLFATPSFAAPIIIGNAAGESELNILMAQKNLSYVFAQCLESETCGAKLDTDFKAAYKDAFAKLEKEIGRAHV